MSLYLILYFAEYSVHYDVGKGIFLRSLVCFVNFFWFIQHILGYFRVSTVVENFFFPSSNLNAKRMW